MIVVREVENPNGLSYCNPRRACLEDLLEHLQVLLLQVDLSCRRINAAAY